MNVILRPSIIWTVFRKEIKEAFRDQMVLFMIFVLPFIMLTIGLLTLNMLDVKGMKSVQKATGTPSAKSQQAVPKAETPAPPATNAAPYKIAVWGEDSLPIRLRLQQTNALTLEIGAGEPDCLRACRTVSPVPAGSNTPPSSATKTLSESDLKLIRTCAQSVITSNQADAILCIMPGFGMTAANQKVGRIKIYYSSDSPRSRQAQTMIWVMLRNFRNDLIRGYEKELGITNGFSVIFDVEESDLSTFWAFAARILKNEANFSKFVLPLCIFLILMLVITSGNALLSDMIVRERELNTRWTLLGAPVDVREIISGKFLAFLAATCIMVFMYVSAFYLQLGSMFQAVASFRNLELPIFPTMSAFIVLEGLLLIFMVIMTACALYMLMATMARDYRFFGYLQTILMFVFTMSLILAIMVKKPPIGLAFVPLLNLFLWGKLLFGFAPHLVFAGISGLTCFLFTGLCLYGSARAFRDEQLIATENRSWLATIGLTPTREPPAPVFALFFFGLILILLTFIGPLLISLKPAAMVLILQYGLFLLPLAIMAVIKRFPLQTTFALRRPSGRSLLGAILIGLFMTPATGLLFQFLPMPEWLREAMEQMVLLDPALPLWSRLLIIAVTPALVEELLFRGLIFSGIRRWGLGPALGLSALLFALLHPPLQLFIPIFTMGIILGMVVWRTGSIFCSMVVHALNNGLMVIIVCFKPTIETWTWLSDTATPYPWCLGLLAILGLALGLRLTWRNPATNQAPP